jgi:hypothetical protein
MGLYGERNSGHVAHMGRYLSMRPSAYRKLASGRLRILPVAGFAEKLASGDYQEHRFEGFAVYTQITDYNYEKVLDVVLLIGEGFPQQKEAVVSHLVSFGKKHGCKAVEALSRRGLAPMLFQLGFKSKKVQLRKDIA